MVKRCEWGEQGNLIREYHDEEWGVSVHDDRILFEFLILEGIQAGLSWSLILKKRTNFRTAFENFEPQKIAKYNEKKVEELMNNSAIIRNRLKIKSVISNAKAFLKVQEEFGSFDKYIWKFVNSKPIVNKFKTLSSLPAKTKESEKMSEELKKRGFKFVGSTICYAFMQAVGMVNDHTIDCFRYDEINNIKIDS